MILILPFRAMEYKSYRTGTAVRAYYRTYSLNYDFRTKLRADFFRELAGKLFAISLKNENLVFIEFASLFLQVTHKL